MTVFVCQRRELEMAQIPQQEKAVRFVPCFCERPRCLAQSASTHDLPRKAPRREVLRMEIGIELGHAVRTNAMREFDLTAFRNILL
jgi:hypothetical protein